jgi:hypothetical protein
MARTTNTTASTPESRIADRLAAKRKATVTTPVEPIETEAADIETLQQRFNAAYEALAAKLGVPSLWRTIGAWVLSIAVAAGVGRLIGVVFDALMMAVFAGTGSAFLATIVWVIGLITAFIAGWKIGGVVFDYVAQGQIDLHYEAVKGKVLGFFKSRSFTPAAA